MTGVVGALERHVYLCHPRWGDCDQFGHLNNVHFLTYLEQARVDLLFHAATREGVAGLAEGIVVARHEIDYLRPVPYRHRPLRVEMWCVAMAGASFTVGYEVFDDEDADGAAPSVRARTLLVPYDLSAARPRRLTPGEREFLSGYLEAPV